MIIHGERNILSAKSQAIIDQQGFYYSAAYAAYLMALGQRTIYFIDDDFVFIIALKQRQIFRFADLIVEYRQYSSGKDANAQQFLDNCIVIMRRHYRVQWLNHPYTSALFKNVPSQCIQIPYGSHIIDLTLTADEIFSSFDRANRNRIKKASSSNVTIKKGGIERLDDFYALDITMRQRNQLDLLNKPHYEQQFSYFNNHIVIYVAYHNNVAQCASFTYQDSDYCYYYYGASGNDMVSGAVNALVWYMIKDAKTCEIGKFSFVGARINPPVDSKYHGINRFKSRFVKEVEPCYLFKVILNKTMYQLYHHIKELKAKRIKGKYAGDIVDQEIEKWKQINDNDMAKSLYKW